MSEIEKMMQNAGVKKLLYCDICNAQEHALGLCAETKCEPFYPPFTAEKQLKIIAFLVNKGYNVTFANLSNKFSLEQISKSLALCINSKWNNLTESEQEQIRSILNG